MKTEKAMAFIGDHSREQLLDAIWHEGHWWIVATWLKPNGPGSPIPERLVQMDGLVLRFQEVNHPTHRFQINNSLPMSVLDGTAQDGYVLATFLSTLDGSRRLGNIH